ncbi:MAG: hypothetical protein HY216_02325 [Candidatus Rokubacteria bacterium]|nr:hypothetical protein [Candidatus Rokubacteria bacterium]
MARDSTGSARGTSRKPRRSRPRKRAIRPAVVLALLAVVAAPRPLAAQELVGKRVFVDQLVVSEPFVEDELSFPSIRHTRHDTNFGAELKKRITTDLEFSLGAGLTRLDGESGAVTGFDNLELGLKYQFLRSESREAVASVGLSWEVGGTGRAAAGAESFDTVSPAVLVGKGFGDLPERLEMLKPMAVSGLLRLQIPTERRPQVLEWGAVIEYSLPYLETFVRRIDLPAPLNRVVPLVEIDMQTDLARADAGKVRGTVNPGAIWVSDAVQIGVEAVVPLDERSGHGLGVRAFLRIPLEEIFGDRAGRPMLR